MKNNLLQIFILLILIQIPVLAQDTTRTNIQRDTLTIRHTNFYTLKVFDIDKFTYNKVLTDTASRNDLQWLPLRMTEDIFSYTPGYFLRYKDVGQFQNLSINQLDYLHIEGLIDGIPVNDIYDGSLDFNLISRAEISRIEHSKLYAPESRNYSSLISFVQNQVLLYRPSSEINYQQDRQDHYYVDVNYHQNISSKINLNAGIATQTYTGNYLNSQSDKWHGRANLNYLFNRNSLWYTKLRYNKIIRGLNEGLNILGYFELNKDILFDNNAIVINPEAFEIKEKFEILSGLNFHRRVSSTDIRLFIINSMRFYEDRLTEEGRYIKDKFHVINYGAKLKQALNFGSRKNLISSLTEGEFNYDILHEPNGLMDNAFRYHIMQKGGIVSGVFNAEGYIKALSFKEYKDKFIIDYGANANFLIFRVNDIYINIYGKYVKSLLLPPYLFLVQQRLGNTKLREETVRNLTGGIFFKGGSNEINISYYFNDISDPWFIDMTNVNVTDDMDKTNSGINAGLILNAGKFWLDGSVSYNIKRSTDFYPQIHGIAVLSYRDLLIRGKLELKAGIQSRFWTDFTGVYFNGYYNLHSDRMNWGSEFNGLNTKLYKNATLDVFVNAKIDKAVLSFAAENLLDIPYATTSVYPFTDRGGFANILSRFTLTWYLFN